MVFVRCTSSLVCFVGFIQAVGAGTNDYKLLLLGSLIWTEALDLHELQGARLK